MAGVKRLWIGDYTEGVKLAATNDMITDIKNTLSSPAQVTFWEFNLPIDIGNVDENTSADPKLGTSFVDISINGTVLGLDQDASDEITSMMRGKQVIIAELYNLDANDKPLYILYGAQNGLDLSGGGSRSGTEASSLQGYELSWVGKERDYASFIDPAKVVFGDATPTTTPDEGAIWVKQ